AVAAPHLRRDGVSCPARVSAVPVRVPGVATALVLLTFEDEAAPPAAGAVRRLEDELRASVEELQTTLEELRASHEETVAGNKERRCRNEDLEAAREELRALNDELEHRVAARTAELEAANSRLREQVAESWRLAGVLRLQGEVAANMAEGVGLVRARDGV